MIVQKVYERADKAQKPESARPALAADALLEIAFIAHTYIEPIAYPPNKNSHD